MLTASAEPTVVVEQAAETAEELTDVEAAAVAEPTVVVLAKPVDVAPAAPAASWR